MAIDSGIPESDRETWTRSRMREERNADPDKPLKDLQVGLTILQASLAITEDSQRRRRRRNSPVRRTQRFVGNTLNMFNPFS
ncbi:MAG: hypothetical protein WBP12_05370 [Candidatus Saccharimonas sp.]